MAPPSSAGEFRRVGQRPPVSRPAQPRSSHARPGSRELWNAPRGRSDGRYAARMLASLLALAAAPGYGASDFLAGLKARTISTMVVAAVSQGAGLLFAVAI